MSNILWAYATVVMSNPRLFKRFAVHIDASKDLNGFNSQDASNIICAYATASESNPWLFKLVADHIVA